MWSCRTLTSLILYIAHTAHTHTAHIAHTPLTSLIHRIYNIKYHEVIHKKYQIYRARNYLDVRASLSASTITLNLYVNELLCPVPLFCLTLCHTPAAGEVRVSVAWHTCLPSVWLGFTILTRHQPGYRINSLQWPYHPCSLSLSVGLATLYSCITTICHIVILYIFHVKIIKRTACTPTL